MSWRAAGVPARRLVWCNNGARLLHRFRRTLERATTSKVTVHFGAEARRLNSTTTSMACKHSCITGCLVAKAEGSSQVYKTDSSQLARAVG